MRRYNIGVGLSLGNKWFTPENIVSQVKWALPHAREYVVVYVADTIHAINLEVRSRMTPERALRVARRYGQELLDAVKAEADKVLTDEERARVLYATWDGISTPDYQKKVSYLYGLYAEKGDFYEKVQSVVRAWTDRDTRTFSPEDMQKLGTYILEELPEVTARVPIDGKVYDAYTYPFDSDLTRWIEEIQQGKSFPEVKEHILDTEPKVFLEVR